MRYIARALALIWAGWWAFFGPASALVEGLDRVGVLIHTAMPGLVFLVSAIIAWKWETVGGVLLVLEGIMVLIAHAAMTYGRFPLLTIIFVLLAMALPPWVAGILFLANWRRSEGRRT